MEEFGSIIKKERMRKGLSITDLSKMTGIDTKTISLLERGIRKKPSLDTLVKLSYILDSVDKDMMFSIGYTDEDIVNYVCSDQYKYTFDITIKGYGYTYGGTIEEASRNIKKDLDDFLIIKNINETDREVKCESYTINTHIDED